MSEITSEILAKIAPQTPQHLRDRFLPFMNEAMPRYGITTKLRVAAFLTTTAFESAYFRATKEGKARANTKAGRAQAKYWSTGFYGRGIIQTTHEEGYQDVGDYLEKKGVIDDADLFVKHPELLEEPRWAVESACVFWTQNGLNRYADSSKIFAIEGITNRGNAAKEAWGEDEREALYKKICKIIPNDFTLGGALPAASSAAVPSPTRQNDVNSVGGPTSSDQDPTGSVTGPQEQPPTIVSEQSSEASGWLDKFKFWKSKADDAQTQISGVQDTLSNVGNKLSPVSKSSWAMVLWTKVMGWGMLALGYYNQHRFGVAVMVIGLVLIVAALAYLHFAKQRGRNDGTSQVQQQKVVINPTSSAGEAA